MLKHDVEMRGRFGVVNLDIDAFVAGPGKNDFNGKMKNLIPITRIIFIYLISLLPKNSQAIQINAICNLTSRSRITIDSTATQLSNKFNRYLERP